MSNADNFGPEDSCRSGPRPMVLTKSAWSEVLSQGQSIFKLGPGKDVLRCLWFHEHWINESQCCTHCLIPWIPGVLFITGWNQSKYWRVATLGSGSGMVRLGRHGDWPLFLVIGTAYLDLGRE